MTKQEVYEQVVRLTAELTAINLASKIFEAAKTGEPEEVETVFETFKKEKPELYQEIIDFGEDYNSEEDSEIFGENKRQAHIPFDANEIDAPNLYCFILIAEIDDLDLFDWSSNSSDIFISELRKEYVELADFAQGELWTHWIGKGDSYYSTWFRLLVAIFKGDFQ